ncbi:MAG: hypothetical protein AB1664_11005 [Thermodesulfobacteriota bacterium]
MSPLRRRNKDICPPEAQDTQPSDEEAREDYLDYCAAAEAIDEALETGEMYLFEDVVKELKI